MSVLRLLEPIRHHYKFNALQIATMLVISQQGSAIALLSARIEPVKYTVGLSIQPLIILMKPAVVLTLQTDPLARIANSIYGHEQEELTA